jgi:hypothetical protein
MGEQELGGEQRSNNESQSGSASHENMDTQDAERLVQAATHFK